MTKIEIEKSDYDELISIKSEAKWLQEKATKFEEESRNKGIALEEAREKAKTEAKNLKVEIEVEKEKLKNISDKLWLKEWEDILEKLWTLQNSHTKYSEILEKENKERWERIKLYKDTLWEDFLKEKEELFEWLDEVKQEKFLKEFMIAKWLDKDKQWNPIKVWVHNDWGAPSDKKSEFDKLNESWADSSKLLSSLANSIDI